MGLHSWLVDLVRLEGYNPYNYNYDMVVYFIYFMVFCLVMVIYFYYEEKKREKKEKEEESEKTNIQTIQEESIA